MERRAPRFSCSRHPRKRQKSHLSAALGRPGELGHPEVRAVVERIVEACLEAAWKFAIFSPDHEDAERWIELGASAVVVGSDASWMIEGAAPVWALAEAKATV